MSWVLAISGEMYSTELAVLVAHVSPIELPSSACQDLNERDDKDGIEPIHYQCTEEFELDLYSCEFDTSSWKRWTESHFNTKPDVPAVTRQRNGVAFGNRRYISSVTLSPW